MSEPKKCQSLEVQNAFKKGWTPGEIENPVQIDCQTGCGRSLTHGKKDRTVTYLCPMCSQSISAFNAKLRKEKKDQKTQEKA